MAKRIKMIINPNADMGNAWKYAADLRHIVEGHGETSWAGTVYPTHASTLAQQAAEEGFDLVVAVGGDGTAHEVINGLMKVPKSKRPVFGIVPFGSGNDYAHNLGIPDDAKKALHAILDGEIREVDIGSIEDEKGRLEYWDNTINIGFGGNVTIYSHKMPLLRGFMMYFVAVLQTIFMRYVVLDVKIKIDDKKWDGKTMMICLNNGPREGGGFITGPKAIMDDGIFDYQILDKVSRLMMFRMIPEFMRGTQERFPIVNPGKFKTMEIESQQPLVLHADGEVYSGFAHDTRKLSVKILPKEIKVMVPKE
jgi:YegS/Rv2252/BmrU family lipid kinase